MGKLIYTPDNPLSLVLHFIGALKNEDYLLCQHLRNLLEQSLKSLNNKENTIESINEFVSVHFKNNKDIPLEIKENIVNLIKSL